MGYLYEPPNIHRIFRCIGHRASRNGDGGFRAFAGIGK